MTINQIQTICSERYGVGIAGLDAISALWLAEHIMRTEGVNVFKKIFNLRDKLGMGTAYPEWSSILF